jgi:hypothetical protein
MELVQFPADDYSPDFENVIIEELERLCRL